MTRESQRLLDQLKKARSGLKHRGQVAAPGMAPAARSSTLDALFEKASAGAHPAPKSVLFVRSDSYGDLIIFAPALARLRALWPSTRIGLLLKEIHRDLIPLLPAGVDYLCTPANPYRETAAEFRQAISLGHQVRDFAPEVLVAPSYEKSWLHALAAAAAPDARRLSLGPAAFDEATKSHLASTGGGAGPDSLYPEVVAVDRDSHELDKSRRLIEHLSQTKTDPLSPGLALPQSAAADAGRVLAKLGLKPGHYVACNPAGNANVAIKSWSPENFAEVLDWLADRSSLRLLLCAHVSEEPVIRSVLSRLADRRLAPAVWLGETGQMPLLAGLLAEARFYIGNDTSSTHLAEAMHTPAVAVYGGGTWPRFNPSLPTSLAIVHPLPCFACVWDCHLVDAPCIKLVRPSDVIAHLPRLLEKTAQIRPAAERVVALRRLPEESLASLKRSQLHAREIEADRAARLAKILTLTSMIKARDASTAEIQRLNSDLQHRLQTAEAAGPKLQAEINQLRERIRSAELESTERQRQIQLLSSALQDTRNECSELTKKLGTAGTAYESEMKRADEKIRQLNQLLAEAKATADAGARRNDALVQENADLAKKTHGQLAALQTLATELEAKSAEREQATTRLQAAKQEIEQLGNQLSALAQQTQVQADELKARTEALATAEATGRRLQRLKEHMEAMLERGARRQHDDAQAIDSLHTRLAEATDRIEAELVARHDTESALAKVQASLAASGAEQERQTEENRELKSALAGALGEAERLRAGLVAADDQLAAVRGEVQDRDAQLARLREEAEAAMATVLREFEVHRAESNRMTAALQEELAAVRVSLGKECGRSSHLTEILAQREADLSALQALLAQERNRGDSIDARLASRESDLADLELAHVQLKKSFHDMQVELQRECARLADGLRWQSEEANLLKVRVGELETASASLQVAAAQSISALQHTLRITRETLAEERRIAAAHRRSAMQLTGRIRQLQAKPKPA